MKHLSRVGERFVVRIGDPENLRGIIGRRELREWLGRDRLIAEREAPAVIAGFYEIIDKAKAALAADQPSLYTAAQSHYRAELMADDRERKVGRSTAVDALNAGSRPVFANSLRMLPSGELGGEEAEALMGHAADALIDKGLASPNADRQELLRVLASAQLDALGQFEARDKGSVQPVATSSPWLRPEPESEAPDPKADGRPKSNGKPLVELLKQFHQERQTCRKTLADGTMGEHKIAVRLLEEIVGRVPADTLTKQDIIKFKNALMRTPTNYRQRFPGMSLPDAIEANARRSKPYACLDSRTINNKFLAHVSTILQWCSVNDLVETNVASGIKVASGKAKNEQTRKPFDQADLKRIFGNELFDDPKSYGTRQWALLMALFTGARSASELARIKLTDIFEQDGVWVVHLSEASKNEHSKRIVPLHKKLIELGLLEYVAKLKEAGGERLFPDWNGDSVNRWFLRTYMPLDGINDRAKVFHSFRHTLKTALAYNGVNRDISDLITGRRDQSVSGMYIADASFTMIKSMKEAIDKVQFDL